MEGQVLDGADRQVQCLVIPVGAVVAQLRVGPERWKQMRASLKVTAAPGNRVTSALVAAHVALGISVCPAAWSGPGDALSVRLGPRITLLGDREQGLRYFPDGGLAIVERTPECRVLMAAGNRTVLLRGTDMRHLRVAGEVLAPGEAGAFDNGYAGVSGVYKSGTNQLLAFYHAEDHEGMPRLANGVPGFYCSVGLAISRDNGATFRKVGPILTSSRPKDLRGHPDQGVGEPCVTRDASGEFLYVYYTSHSRLGGRGVQICMARCPVRAASEATAWRKLHEGAFGEPGIGGRDTPVLSGEAVGADAVFPHVTYCSGLGKYVMVYCVNAYQELGAAPRRSGIYAAFSSDGLRWPERDQRQLLVGYTVPCVGKELAWHPTLVLDSGAVNRTAKGWLYYSYTESWGHNAPHKAHYLVGAPIELSVEDGESDR
jgi:hypothetical protein